MPSELINYQYWTKSLNATFDKKSTDRVIVKGSVSACVPRNTFPDFGLDFLVKAIPIAPEEYIFWLWKSVTGLPVMNGVDVAVSPS